MRWSILSSLHQLSKGFHEKIFSPSGITKQCLALAEQNSHLNAFVKLTSKLAQEKSTEAENRYATGKKLGPLDGVPIAIKDNFCTRGIETTCASNMLKEFVPTYSATVVDRLEKQGAIIMGKTNMDQFGMGSGTVDSIFGPTKNPWSKSLEDDEWRIAGGSSGGSAVAVAKGICYGALGSDTGGSTRNPASYCGVIGYKPTYGLVSRHGLIPLVNSMDVPGILTRNVDDCAAMLNAIAGPDVFDSTTVDTPFTKFQMPEVEKLSVNGIKVGIPLEYHCEGLSQEVLDTWTKVADLLENYGAQVSQVSLPNTALSIATYTILNQCEIASNMARYDGVEYGHRADEETSTEALYAQTRAEGFNKVVINRIYAGNFFLLKKNYDLFFKRALKIRRLIVDDFNKIFYTDKKFDILLTPTTLTDAPTYSDFIKGSNREQCALQDYCTQPANMSGVPAISIPIRLSSNGLPISLQLMAPSMSDQQMLTVAKWIESKVNFTSLARTA